MPKPHWTHPDTNTHGCQHTTCHQPAHLQWQREATDTEVEHEMNLTGPYGKIYRNPEGPHSVAVFACENHAPNPKKAAIRHTATCPAPDDGCTCA